MKIVFDFSDNYVSRNIIRKILAGGASAIAELKANGSLRDLPKHRDYPLYCHLAMKNIEDYARIGNTTVGYFFFNEEHPNPPGYTPWDQEFVEALDTFSEEQLQRIIDIITELYPASFSEKHSGDSHNLKIGALLNNLPFGMLDSKNIVKDPGKTWQGDFAPEIDRLRKTHYRYAYFVYGSEYLVDLATYCGISLHWILGLKGPLFCKTAAGDRLFDHITFLGHDQQKTVLSILKELAAAPEEILQRLGRPRTSESLILTVDPINEHALRSIPREEAVAWLTSNGITKQILRNHRDRVIDYVYSPETPPQISTREEAYCPDDVIRDSLTRVYAENKNQCPSLLTSTIYCALRYKQTSCHSLIFGTHKPVTLRGRYRRVVDSLAYISEDLRKQLLLQLQASTLVVTHPPAVLQRRIAELASYANLPSVTFCNSFFRNTHIRRELFSEFFSAPLPWKKPNQTHSEKGQALFWFSRDAMFYAVLFIAIFCDVSADYLLLQDFSRYVVWNGSLLPDSQKEFLSSFLLATPEAQDAVLAKLVAAQF